MIGPQVAQQAEQWLGTPFVWQGRIRNVGCDCKGLLAGVARELDRPEASSVEALCGDYGGVVPTGRLREGLARLFDKVTDIQPGDILLLRINGAAQHLAIATSPTDMIHSYPGGPAARVLKTAIPKAKLDSIWRWRD